VGKTDGAYEKEKKNLFKELFQNEKNVRQIECKKTNSTLKKVSVL
jgi:hypothetical protein